MATFGTDNIYATNTINSKIVDPYGNNLLTSTVKTAFGELATVSPDPRVQVFLNKIKDPRIWNQYTGLGGSAYVASGMGVLECGSSPYGYSAIQTIDRLAYQPGVGIYARYTAMFDSGVANSLLLAGPYHAEEGFGFGYSGTQFGIMHRYGRKLEIQKVAITGASAGNATITLNGKPNVVTIATATVTGAAREIAEWTGTFSDYQTTYKPHQIDNNVYFHRQYHGQTTGAFSYVNGGFLGAFSAVQSGAAGTEDWHYQTGWNLDRMDGSGIGGMILDKSKLNIYGFTIGWLGSLPIVAFVGSENRQELQPVHIIKWTNTDKAIQPHCNDPRFPIGYAVSSLGSTTNLSIKGASALAGIHDGQNGFLGPRFSAFSRKAGVTTTETPILTVQCTPIDLLNNTYNRRRLILKSIIASNLDNTIDFTVNIYRASQSVLVGYGFRSYFPYSLLLTDTQATAILQATELNLIQSFGLPVNTPFDYHFDDENAFLQGDDCLIVTAYTSSSTATISIAVNGFEDV